MYKGHYTWDRLKMVFMYGAGRNRKSCKDTVRIEGYLININKKLVMKAKIAHPDKLPKKWQIKITEKNRKSVRIWFIDNFYEGRFFKFKIGTYYFNNTSTMESSNFVNMQKGKLITTKDFNRYVLGLYEEEDLSDLKKGDCIVYESNASSFFKSKDYIYKLRSDFMKRQYYPLKVEMDNKGQKSGFLNSGFRKATYEESQLYYIMNKPVSIHYDVEELKREAEKKYPIGTKFKCVNGNNDSHRGVKDGIFTVTNHKINKGGGIQSGNGWIFLRGKWAEIIEEKVESKDIELVTGDWYKLYYLENNFRGFAKFKELHNGHFHFSEYIKNGIHREYEGNWLYNKDLTKKVAELSDFEYIADKIIKSDSSNISSNTTSCNHLSSASGSSLHGTDYWSRQSVSLIPANGTYDLCIDPDPIKEEKEEVKLISKSKRKLIKNY